MERTHLLKTIKLYGVHRPSLSLGNGDLKGRTDVETTFAQHCSSSSICQERVRKSEEDAATLLGRDTRSLLVFPHRRDLVSKPKPESTAIARFVQILYASERLLGHK